MPNLGLIRSYAEGYEAIYGPNGNKSSCEAWFKQEFPEGHATSIRPFFQEHLEAVENGVPFEKGTKGFKLNEIHPRAFRLLVDNGVDYVPHEWNMEAVRTSSLQPRLGQCFSNTYCMMEALNRKREPDEEEIVYVEGIVIGALAYPMLHAWNAVGMSGAVARDWSHYLGCEWSRYLGIPVTQKEHWEMCSIVHPRKPQLLCRMLHRESFPKIESYLTDLLRSRSANPAAQK